tara:strand:+ start:498 stop:764 length:267 start_codon:yes stop_codon:yes gene_type:complete
MTNKKTITSTDFQKIFWLNDNLDFCCSSLDIEDPTVNYVSSLIASTNSTADIEKLLEIHQHLVIVSMGGFSTMLDSYRNKQTQPLPKQ